MTRKKAEIHGAVQDIKKQIEIYFSRKVAILLMSFQDSLCFGSPRLDPNREEGGGHLRVTLGCSDKGLKGAPETAVQQMHEVQQLTMNIPGEVAGIGKWQLLGDSFAQSLG